MTVVPPPLRVHTLIDSMSWGGAEMLLADLAAGAPAAGIELSVGYLKSADGDPAAAGLRRNGVEPTLVPVARLAEPGALPRLRRHLAAVRPDVVHTHLGLADVLGTLAARSLRLPSFSTIHLLAGRPTGRPADATRAGALKHALAGRVRRHGCARVLTVSEAARDAYLATGWDRPDHVVTVHNGVRRSAGAADGAALRAELGLAPDALVVATVTVLRPGKGHAVALDAVARLRDRFPRLRLLVLGDGPAREQVRELAAPLGDAVVMAGHRDDVMAVLSAVDVVLHPTDVDAFPTALLEAGAAAVPVVATAVGGIPEIVADGDSGLLVPAPPRADAVADALARLLGDDALRARLGAAAQARYRERFTAEQWALRLRRRYDEELARRQRATRLRLAGSRSRQRS